MFEKDDIISYCGETFLVVENHGESGRVLECDAKGNPAPGIISNFHWRFQDEVCVKVGHRSPA